MSHYTHHVPGRLRVKSPHLKRNPRRAEEAQLHLGGIEGVLSAEANPLTGSLLITYDARRVGAEALFDSLRGLGHVGAGHPAPASVPAAHDPVQRMTDTLVNKLVETALERSATALIAAIL